MKRFPYGKAFFSYSKKFYLDELAHIVYQMLDFLPKTIQNALGHLNLSHVYELRIRADKPITINFKGNYQYLGALGRTERKEEALRATIEDIAECVYKAGNYSVYSVEEQIKKGFITAQGGERIGLAGEYVFEKGQPLALRNFTSLCIRIPHEIIGCGEEIYQCCMSDIARNVLLMSPPGLGKTTVLRDLGRIISMKTKANVLICDERGEIAVGMVGETCDIVKYADKATAFEAGIRAMRPDVIITDELLEKDLPALGKAVCAGVTVLASAHFSAMEKLSNAFLSIFERFVLLDTRQIGRIKGIYDRNGKELI